MKDGQREIYTTSMSHMNELCEIIDEANKRALGKKIKKHDSIIGEITYE